MITLSDDVGFKRSETTLYLEVINYVNILTLFVTYSRRILKYVPIYYMFCTDAGSGHYFMLWLSGTGVNKGSFIKVKIILVNVQSCDLV